MSQDQQRKLLECSNAISDLKGILDGCRQNHLTQKDVRRAVEETKKELEEQDTVGMRHGRKAERNSPGR